MKIHIQSDSQMITVIDRIELRERARRWLCRARELIMAIGVRISDACASAGAGDRFCVIEARLSNGMRLSTQARGYNTVIAIDRALRRLARTIRSHLKRDGYTLASA